MGFLRHHTPRDFVSETTISAKLPVHMNGRIYDPLLGRMLSADLFVQYPGSLQSYNRYSYVQNNPLTSIDPSGFETKDKVAGVIDGTGNTIIVAGNGPSIQANEDAAANEHLVADVLRFVGLTRAADSVDHLAQGSSERADLSREMVAAGKQSVSEFSSQKTGSTDVNHPDRVAYRKGTEIALGVGVPLVQGLVAAKLATTESTPAEKGNKKNSVKAPGAGTGVIKPTLTDAQSKKLQAFDNKTPANAPPAQVDQLGDQVLFTAVSPGRVPGSSKVYQKSVAADGTTTSYVKTTVTPDNPQQKVTDASTNPETVLDVNSLPPLDKDKLKR